MTTANILGAVELKACRRSAMNTLIRSSSRLSNSIPQARLAPHEITVTTQVAHDQDYCRCSIWWAGSRCLDRSRSATLHGGCRAVRRLSSNVIAAKGAVLPRLAASSAVAACARRPAGGSILRHLVLDLVSTVAEWLFTATSRTTQRVYAVEHVFGTRTTRFKSMSEDRLPTHGRACRFEDRPGW